MISIIVPVYNAEKYLRQCIDSVLQQTYKEWELLLVNDGSKDGSLSICQKYSKKDSRIILIDKPNGGVSSARNKGLKRAKGEWITFMDSDDWLDSNAFETYIEAADRTGADIVKVGYKIHKVNKIEEYSINEEVTLSDNSKLMQYLQSSHYYGFVWNSLFKREITSGLKFDETIPWLEDQFFSYECFLRGVRVTLLPKIVYNYRIHEMGSLSGVQDPFVIANSADKDIEYKRKLFGHSAPESLNACWNTYHQWYARAIHFLYNGGYSYKQRKDFYLRFHPIDNTCFYSEEKQFYDCRCSFVLKDTLIRAKRNLRVIKEIIR